MPQRRQTSTTREARKPKGTGKKVPIKVTRKARVDPIIIKRVKMTPLILRLRQLDAIKTRSASAKSPEGKLRPKQQREYEKLKKELKANKPKRTSKSGRYREA